MADFKEDSWLQSNNDTSNISMNIKKHIKNGRHRAKYNFVNDPTDIVDQNVKEYNGIDYIKPLITYMDEKNLGRIEFSVFQCKSRSTNLPAFYANIKVGQISLASSFPEKYSLPDVAKQVAARNALAILKKKCSSTNIPVTQDMAVVAKRLELELKKNYAGLFCDKVEDIYKEVYNESLPMNWLSQLSKLETNIVVETLTNQNKSILYYGTVTHQNKVEPMDIVCSLDSDCTIPLMQLVDKSERSIVVNGIDSNHTFWIQFINDDINDGYEDMFESMNNPEESKHFIRMFSIELFDVYTVKVENEWYRFQVVKIEDDNITGILIDLGMEWCVTRNSVMFLPQKHLKVPSQTIKCALTSLFFAPYFKAANELFNDMLFGKEFTLIPDSIDGDVPLVTLYKENTNMNAVIKETIVQRTSFNRIDGICKRANLSYIDNGYIYLHPPNETLVIMESVLDSISVSRPLDKLYSKESLSPKKVYLVECKEMNMWSRAIISDFIFTGRQFKVYFIDYGNYGLIDCDKFIDLQSIDSLLACIGPQALKVGFHLFPPEKLTASQSRALYELVNGKSLEVKVVSTDNDGIQVVEIFDANDENANRISFNTQLYQSV